MVTRFPWQPVIVSLAIVPKDKCAKYELDITLNSKVMKEKYCYHGNSVSLATSVRSELVMP